MRNEAVIFPTRNILIDHWHQWVPLIGATIHYAGKTPIKAVVGDTTITFITEDQSDRLRGLALDRVYIFEPAPKDIEELASILTIGRNGDVVSI